MQHNPPDPQFKSAERLAFETYLRTGKRLSQPPERKFNPYHDPRNGQFTFAPGGPRSIGGTVVSDRQGLWKRKREPTVADADAAFDGPASTGLNRGQQHALAKAPEARFQLAGGGRSPRRGRGRGGRRLPDPMLLDEAFPGLSKSPLGTVVKIADGVLELTTAAKELTASLHRAEVRRLVAQIRAIDSDYHFHSLSETQTLAGQAHQIKTLRFERAVAFYKKRGEARPLQVEVLRVMQERADSAYDDAVKLYDAGRLPARLSRQEAIGNFIDRAVKKELRERFSWYGIDYSAGQPIRVVGREYDSSGTDLTYRVPDARVLNIAYDVTLTQKTIATPQIQGFFSSDFRPELTIIVRPRQLGTGSTYAINRPRR